MGELLDRLSQCQYDLEAHAYDGGYKSGVKAAAFEWQAIATAPEDTPILVTDGKVAVVVKRVECGGRSRASAVGFDGYEWDFHFEWDDLTHWMPIPEPPSV